MSEHTEGSIRPEDFMLPSAQPVRLIEADGTLAPEAGYKERYELPDGEALLRGYNSWWWDAA